MYWEHAGDQRTALFRIDVIEIPIDSPGDAKIVDSPEYLLMKKREY